ncbi:glycosyltransferase family 4 protein [Rhizobium sp. KVB221]|uniref:Glycosyltransferase family 4 protein n=1 Tax=Rhizobium setariae TaxID=2801340 RepID=A0A936YRX6_9HYPH|nr:glycosyltransferase family 4 protein [Rhizobium setariae]MBL0373652.1 glycosyltransferase family 4 protein [Rhizobium setariae]
MKIALYAPLKPASHPVPSGDRLMARLLKSALEHAGHQVDVVSELRTYLKEPSSELYSTLKKQAEAECERLSALWLREGAPDLWFTYHPYYKSPDLIGLDLARSFSLPYVTAEASYSSRRNIGVWAQSQAEALAAVEQAAVNICFTRRDQEGLIKALPTARTAMLPPFLDSSRVRSLEPNPQPGRLATVAMMREGNKLESYCMLARALELLLDLPWTLAIAGDGVCRKEVEAAFAAFPPGRVEWHGLKPAEEVAVLLSEGSIFLWPGCREAYGLSYLEAQAAGLPVVGQAEGGVPEVVVDGRSGILTPSGDLQAYADAIRLLLTDDVQRKALAAGALQFARQERSFQAASERLAAILDQFVGGI